MQSRTVRECPHQAMLAAASQLSGWSVGVASGTAHLISDMLVRSGGPIQKASVLA
ncbi:hypothetical protein [Sphingobium baderi]|uniref:Uncharacterized protein n=1 Tax=Sphingobium baderi LL03 TaxID=1114964 RepID=T0GWW9_9SPHN|nr:hypothetical protein [Sphingobium baderi]EQB05177.1 hypothetical protein L485_03395 [Sphingobium baderi LL03]KMS59056.1 hypothetical protein V475_20710 [Sphingobium baderi LL03]WRD78899.1 hypothetical protein QQ987_19745 [Sphingobium baderi]